MRNIKLCYWGLIVTLTLLWLAADPVWMAETEFFTLRSSLVIYTGIIAVGLMSVSMMLAARPVMIESLLGGLDKMYRLHKWLGITGVTFAIVHLLWAKSAGWLVGWGWLVRQGGHHGGGQGTGLAGFFQEQRGLAKSIGEWALYALIVLLVLALLKRFSYRRFFKTHRLLAVIYLFLVFHSVVLMKSAAWGKPVGLVILVLMTGGTVGAFISLFRRVGAGRRVTGEIADITRHMDNRVLKVAVKLTDPWPGHMAGQFAFLTFDRSEGPHPFTICSTWNHDGRLGFLIKGIGDYTDTLAARLKAGDSVIVEGPYGRFDFKVASPDRYGLRVESASRHSSHAWRRWRGTRTEARLICFTAPVRLMRASLPRSVCVLKRPRLSCMSLCRRGTEGWVRSGSGTRFLNGRKPRSGSAGRQDSGGPCAET